MREKERRMVPLLLLLLKMEKVGDDGKCDYGPITSAFCG